MRKRLEVLVDDGEYNAIRDASRKQRLTVSEWVRRALRQVLADEADAVETRLRAIVVASRHRFPTADIEVMLDEIEQGRALRSGTPPAARR